MFKRLWSLHINTKLCCVFILVLGRCWLLQSRVLEKYKSINCCSSQMDERGHKICILSFLNSQSSINP